MFPLLTALALPPLCVLLAIFGRFYAAVLGRVLRPVGKDIERLCRFLSTARWVLRLREALFPTPQRPGYFLSYPDRGPYRAGPSWVEEEPQWSKWVVFSVFLSGLGVVFSPVPYGTLSCWLAIGQMGMWPGGPLLMGPLFLVASMMCNEFAKIVLRAHPHLRGRRVHHRTRQVTRFTQLMWLGFAVPLLLSLSLVALKDHFMLGAYARLDARESAAADFVVD